MTRLAFLRMLGMVPVSRYGSMGQAHRRPDQQTDAPPSAVAPTQAAGVVRARLVVIFGTGPRSGLFVYSPSPGTGNLIASIAAAAGTDPYSNAFQPGIVSYSGSIVGELFSASLRFFNETSTPSSPPTVFSADAAAAGARITVSSGKGTGAATQAVMTLADSLLGTGGVAQVVIGTAAAPLTAFTSALLEIQGTIGTTLIKAIVSGALETWHNPVLAAGFSAGSPAPRFQIEPVNGGRVRLAGIVNLTATEAAGTTMFTLPAGYLPAQFHSFVTSNSLSGYTLGARAVQVNSTGQVQLGSSGVNTNFVVLDGICFELD